MKKIIFIILFLFSFYKISSAQNNFSLAGGMGIEFLNNYSLNDYLSYYWNYSNNRGDFKSFINFFTNIGYDISKQYNISVDLSYSIGSYSNNLATGLHQLDINVLQPNILLFRYWKNEFYKISVGGGGGYYSLSYKEKLPNQVETINSSTTGFGVTISAIGDTYLSNNLFISLIGELKLIYYKEIDFKIRTGPNTYSIGKLNFDSRGASLKIGLKYFFD